MTVKKPEKDALDRLVKAMSDIIRPKPQEERGQGGQRK